MGMTGYAGSPAQMEDRVEQMKMKIHLHVEQFDGYLHAACGQLDAPVGSPRIFTEDDFSELPRSRRCARCTREWWPIGGDPE